MLRSIGGCYPLRSAIKGSARFTVAALARPIAFIALFLHTFGWLVFGIAGQALGMLTGLIAFVPLVMIVISFALAVLTVIGPPWSSRAALVLIAGEVVAAIALAGNVGLKIAIVVLLALVATAVAAADPALPRIGRRR